MPGVADTVRRTQLTQERRARKKDIDELLIMVKEKRLHEADARQLELLEMALDLNKLMEQDKSPPVVVQQDNEALIEALKKVVAELLVEIPQGRGVSPLEDTERPEMRYSSLVDIKHEDPELDVSHKEALTEEYDGDEESSDKLEKLKRLKGNK